jgi:hypothetical protein
VSRPFIAAIASGALAWALHRAVAPVLPGAALRLMVAATAMACIYMATFALLPGGRARLAALIGTARELFDRRA